MNIKEKIYSQSPIWFQNQLISMYGRKLYKRRYTGVFQAELQRLKERDITDATKMKELQNEMFLDFLNYTVNNSPFYREFYKDVDLSRIKTVEDITLLPIIDKEILRENIEQV